MEKEIFRKIAEQKKDFDESMKKKYKEEKELEEKIKKEQNELIMKAEMGFETLGSLKRKKFFNDRIDLIIKDLKKINRINRNNLNDEQLARLNTIKNVLRDSLKNILKRITYKLSRKRLNDIRNINN